MSNLEWLTVGLALILLELFVPGTYLVWFGFAALVVSLCATFFVWTLVEQVVVFAGLSVIFAIAGWRIYGKLIRRMPEVLAYKYLNNSATQYIGKKYTLDEDVIDGKAKVRIADVVWLATCEEALKKGDTVIVTGVVKGVILEVKAT